MRRAGLAVAAVGAALVGVSRQVSSRGVAGASIGPLLTATAAASDAVPSLLRAGPPGLSPERTARDLRVLSANVLYTNPIGSAGLADLVARHAPDVVIAVEAHREAVRRLEPVLREYGHLTVEQSGRRRILIATSLPVLDTGAVRTPAISRLPWITVGTPAGPLRVVAVHTWAPLGIALGRGWALEMDRLAGFAEETPGPLVMAGDFNASPGHRPYRELLRRGGLRDAVGGVPTFPAPGHRLPVGPLHLPTGPVLSLDHVLVRGLDVTGAALGHEPGSDHLPVLADLRLPG
jgi:endonuclease/exonuclease/phosphatase (EEP) superfamily protein YafD